MPLIETFGSGGSRGFGQFGKIPQTFTNVVSYSYTGAAQYFNIPGNISELKIKMWGAAGGEYNSSVNRTNGGGAGGFTETTFNILPGETTLTLVVGGGANYGTPGYGGGGYGPNGGSAGGGCSAIFSGNISNPFSNATSGIATYNAPSSTVQNLTPVTQVIAVAGGGGGAGWYNWDNLYAGGGGGLIGASSSGGYTTAPGGTQSSSSNGDQSQFAGKFQGGSPTANQSSGGSGGGGGGWYGGTSSQGSSGNNTSGGGGSSFIGYQNGSTSTVLTPNQANSRDYIDTITRINGSRYYKNSKTLSNSAGTFTAPNNTDIHYVSGIAVPTYYPGNDGTNILSGHGRIVLIY